MRTLRLLTLVAVACLAAPPPLADDQAFCDLLRQVVDAADGSEGLASITGADTGLYFEAKVELPGAKLCLIRPDRRDEVLWGCLLASDGKYTLALQAQARYKKQIEKCLGEDWQSSGDVDEGYLAETEFRREGSKARVQLLTTKQVEPRNRWKEHRVVLVVYGPHASSENGAVSP